MKNKPFLNKMTLLKVSALVIAVSLGYSSIGIFSLTAQSSNKDAQNYITNIPRKTATSKPAPSAGLKLAQVDTKTSSSAKPLSSSSSSKSEKMDDNYSVQAVLAPRKSVVITAPMDGKLNKLAVQDGDEFEKGTVLAEYDCGMDWARKRELSARVRMSEKKLGAFKRLYDLDNISELEYVTAVEGHAQDQAILDQLNHKLKLCKVQAPFPGRVSVKKANALEVVQAGRVLLEIVSAEPLNAELLVPSRWLRWLNVGTPVSIFIEESKRNYDAHIVRVHGEVDPVSQSAHVVAQIDNYEEDLLPGMSGLARFSSESAGNFDFGFMGLTLAKPEK